MFFLSIYKTLHSHIIYLAILFFTYSNQTNASNIAILVSGPDDNVKRAQGFARQLELLGTNLKSRKWEVSNEMAKSSFRQNQLNSIGNLQLGGFLKKL